MRGMPAPRRKPVQHEHKQQVALFEWADLAVNTMPLLRLLYAIPNGGLRNIVTARRLKREGVRAGVPDVCLPVPLNGYGALYVEMKAGKNTTSESQDNWLDDLEAAGNMCVVCWTWEEAKAVICDYLSRRVPPRQSPSFS
jgi:hypothetical protein